MILKFTQMNKYILILSLIIFFCNRGISQNKENYGTMVDKIIVKVDDYIILKSELERSYAEVLSRGQQGGNETKCQVLEGLVLNKMMAAKAEIDSIVVSDDQVETNLDMRMNQILSQVGGDEEALEEYYGKTIAEFKDELRDQVREQMVVQEVQRTIVNEITVTPKEVNKFFDNIPKDSLPYFSTEVVVGQIVKKPSINEKAKNNAERLLLDLKQRVIEGEDFQELASIYSEGPSARYGGNLGWVKRGQMVPEFEAAAMKLKPGEVSDPVETEFGVHIIESVDRRGNEYNSRHILIQHKYEEEDYKKAGEFLDSLRNVITHDSIRFEMAAKEYSDDKNTAATGGYFIGNTGSNHISTSELDAGLFFTLDSMTVGTISSPMKFQMPDGKEAMRIIFYKEKFKPHQANLKDDYQKIQIATKNAKQNKIMNEWFMDAKDDVYIEVDEEYKNCKILQ